MSELTTKANEQARLAGSYPHGSRPHALHMFNHHRFMAQHHEETIRKFAPQAEVDDRVARHIKFHHNEAEKHHAEKAQYAWALT